MLTAVITITALAACFGLLLGYSAIRFKVEGDPIADQIDALLPQTQCGQCSYAGCRPYAEAIASGEAEINRCPPGGETTMIALAELLGRDPVPLEDEAAAEKPKSVARIIEKDCIGCGKCVKGCNAFGNGSLYLQIRHDRCINCNECTIAKSCPSDAIKRVPAHTPYILKGKQGQA